MKSNKFIILVTFILMAFALGDSKGEYTISRAAYSVYSTDFYLNGFNDLIIGHKTAWGDSNITVSVLKNDLQGFFSIDTTVTFCGYQENIFAIKLNEDQYPDIVAFYSDFSSGVAERFVRVYKTEQGDLVSFSNYSLNSSSTFSTINYGDIDGDNFEDILVVSNLGQFWGILYNDGTGNFSEPEYHYVYDYHPSAIDCGDLNEDGREDVVICGQKTEVYFSYPGNFQKITLETDDFKDGINLTDFDQDNDLDIISFVDLYIVNYTRIKIYENLGNNDFATLENYDFQPSCTNMFLSDLNNDSLPDMVFHTSDQTGAYIFYNEGNFLLSESQFIEISDYGEYSRNSYCADLDGNGYNDIITLRYLYAPLSNNLSILFNDGNGNFQEDPITNIQTSNSETNTSNLTCYPNPFNTKTTIKINIIENELTELTVYNLSGKKVKNLTNNEMKGGTISIEWNGLDNGGKPCKPGPYLLTLKVNGNVLQTIKLIKY
jgi:hypothetical protein